MHFPEFVLMQKQLSVKTKIYLVIVKIRTAQKIIKCYFCFHDNKILYKKEINYFI